jgi:hypothetical protein
MQSILFREWVSTGNLVRIFMISFSFIIIFGTILFIIFGNITTEDYCGLIIAFGVLAFVLVLFWNYKGIEIKFGPHELSIKYGVFNKRSIRLAQIASCKVTKASFKRYGGIRVRYGFDGSTAYTTSFGNVIEIVQKKGYPFIFSTKNLEIICKTINEQISRKRIMDLI